jgi:hypothetical protein
MGFYPGRQVQEYEGFAELSDFLATHGSCCSPKGTFEEYE